MQPSLLHRLKNIRQRESHLYYTHNINYDIVNTLITDLFLLFSSRPLLSVAEHNETVGTSILNYGVRIVDGSIINDSRELIKKKIEANILHAIHLYEKRLYNVTIEQCGATAEKITFKVSGFFFNISVSFIVSWEISAASYSLNIIR